VVRFTPCQLSPWEKLFLKCGFFCWLNARLIKVKFLPHLKMFYQLKMSCKAKLYFCYVLLAVHPSIIFFQMKPTTCTLILSVFISTSVHISGNYVPIISKTYCIYATLVFFTRYVWLSGLGWVAVWSADQPATHTERKIPVSRRYSKFWWWWAYSCPKHVVKFKWMYWEVVCT
jgi:hypothetical protein